MANNRPTSMIISSVVFDETNPNGSKNITQKKDSLSVRSSNQQKLPVNNIAIAHSSSSSIDSTGAKNAIILENTSVPQMNSIATISSTTTDSELESEQEERYTDDNNSLESTTLPTQRRRQQQQSPSRRVSDQQKSDVQTPEQLSRRVKHFQKLFKTDIVDDTMPELIDSYVCAYQGDILLQGKMYITDRYLCFHSRIISYVTKHVYRWEQINNVTKERVAFIFPTAIGIQLKPSGKKIIYASFLQRDQAFEKIISICSRFNNDTISLQDDDDNHFTQSGTLKTINSNHSYYVKPKKCKRDNHYEIPDESEHDNVLQMCLRQDRTNNNNNNNTKRRPQSISSKSSDDKQIQQSKKLFNSDKKNTSLRISIMDQNLSNDFNHKNETDRKSRSSNNQQKQTDTILRDNTVVYRQSHNTSSRTHRSHSRDRTLSPTNHTLTNIPHSNSSSGLITNNNASIIDSNDDGLIRKNFRIIILSVISVIKLIIEYLLLLFNQFKTYPIKTSVILLIFVTILIIHSFYLMKLAYRIENRLQSLHTGWPSSSMKNSLPSLKEL